MASDVDIVNIGLIAIGENTISTLEGTQTRQEKAKAIYAPTRKALLTEIDWRFATTTQILARQATEPVDTRFKYQYSLPADPELLKVIRLEPGGQYKIQGNVLLSNNSTEEMTYLADVAEKIMPPHFVLLLGYKIGMELAIPLTKKTDRYKVARDKFTDQWHKSTFADASQQPPEEEHSQPFIACRY